MTEQSTRGPNYDWEMEARALRTQLGRTRELLDQVTTSAERVAWQRDKSQSQLAEKDRQLERFRASLKGIEIHQSNALNALFRRFVEHADSDIRLAQSLVRAALAEMGEK